jgi:preprotein translocase subunit YajC
MDVGIPLILAQGGADPRPERQEDGGLGMMPIIILTFAFVYFFMIRPQKKEADAKTQLLEGLRKNDKVVTTGGIIGTIVNIKDDEVTVRVDDQNKVKIRFLKSAVARVAGGEAKQPAEEAKKS